MLQEYSKDYFSRLAQNKDVFIYGALTGALVYFLAVKYIVKKQ